MFVRSGPKVLNPRRLCERHKSDEPVRETSDRTHGDSETMDRPARTFGMPPVAAAGDLAANSPGQAARQRADLEWQKRRSEKPIRAVLGRFLDVHTDERAWRIGADGEEMVANQLLKVVQRDPRWRLLHAVPVGHKGADIDHVAIGPGGVFTINVKHHPGARVWVGGSTFIVNGQRVPYIRNSHYEAQRASRLLSKALGAPLPVMGIIVPVRCKAVTIKTPPVGVVVVPRFNVARWMLHLPWILTEQQIHTIFQVARRPATWQR